MDKLKFSDFVDAVTISQPAQFYLSFEFKDYELCLEKCLSGFDVALYRKGPAEQIAGLVEPKKCTDFNFKRREGKMLFGLNGLKKGERNMVILRAMKYANEFYKKYNN